MQHDTLLVLDIETVPDRKHHEEEGFPKPPFDKVVARTLGYPAHFWRGNICFTRIETSPGQDDGDRPTAIIAC